jgi:putative NIF3 family GTP cyclohydrolase 1 type 2
MIMKAAEYIKVAPQDISLSPVRPGAQLLQRKCACGGTPGTSGECENCGRKREAASLQRATDHRLSFNSRRSEVPLIVHDVLRSPGQPLDAETRAFMEPRFGHDFSNVRVHTDSSAAASASAVNSLAYAVGQNVVFGAGQYGPGTTEGRRLLAHELSHTIQQRHVTNAAPSEQLSLAPSESSHEREAESASRSLGPNFVRTKSPRCVQRKTWDTLPVYEERPEVMAGETPAGLTARIARCVGIWETNRGGTDPAPRESALDTVAGVHASMATIEQATMTYAITQLKSHKDLRDMATPPLTMVELNAAEARCIAVVTLLGLVAAASAAGQSHAAFITANAAAITATGLSNADVQTMFNAVTLKSTLDTAHTNVDAAGTTAKAAAAAAGKTPKKQASEEKKAKAKALKDEIAAIPAADRLGLGEGSLKAYINKPANWGENRAGWQRKAVNAMAGDVGRRIESVAISRGGTALAIPAIRSRVDAQFARKPVPSTEQIVKTVAQQNNPGEANYGQHVWETYQRLYP